MKIILLQDVKNLGKSGDVREVTGGYGRNFLIPQKMAEPATQEAIEKIAREKQKTEELKNRETEELKNLAKKLEGKEVVIKVKEKDGKLFGSIGKKEIAEKLGSGVSEDMIELEENIKETGKKEIIANFDSNVKAKIIVNILGEK